MKKFDKRLLAVTFTIALVTFSVWPDKMGWMIGFLVGFLTVLGMYIAFLFIVKLVRRWLGRPNKTL